MFFVIFLVMSISFVSVSAIGVATGKIHENKMQVLIYQMTCIILMLSMLIEEIASL